MDAQTIIGDFQETESFNLLILGFYIQNLSITVGPFTGFYRVAVEAFAILGSLFLPSA